MEWYDGLYGELFTSFHMRRHEPAIYHFLFAENDFCYLPKLRPIHPHKVICTFHATPGEFARVMNETGHLEFIDAAIVVASNQVPVLEPIVGKDKVFSIPHGVDSDYFIPPSQMHNSTKTCICVGHHHRDFDTLARVATLIREVDPDVHLIVIDRAFSLHFSLDQQHRFTESFASAGNVELRTHVTDEELLRLYQSSDLMILPLFDTTANVAVLEALSCGLPLVVTDIGGIRDYIDPDGAAFALPQDAESMADHVIRLLRNPDERERLSQLSRNKALSFQWRSVAEKVKTLYRHLTIA